MLQSPISIHIPSPLQHHVISPSKFLELHQNYAQLVVGALIFAPAHLSSPAVPRILLVQRATTERGFPNLWEIPGGTAESSDPTILHSVAREVFEETGLHLVRFVRQIGNGEEFLIGGKHNRRNCLKLSFEIEVVEIGNPLLAKLSNPLHKYEHHHEDENEAAKDIPTLETIHIDLDPKEHQAARWATEKDLKMATCFLSSGELGTDKKMSDIAHMEGDLRLVSEDQRQLILEAFRLHNADIERVTQHAQQSTGTSSTVAG